jgi:GNAT superfamily N-acetyltransferase
MGAIRPAVEDDAEAIADVFIAARERMTYLPPDGGGARPYFVEIATKTMEFWVAEDEDGRVVAIAGLDPDMLEHLYVHPDAQGQGLGSALLDKAKERRPDGFTFWVFQKNTGACRFYERHGCVEVRRTDGAGNMEKEPDVLYAWSPA